MNRIFFQSKSSGLTIVEALIGIGFLSSMVAGLGIYAKNLKDNIRKTEIGQVADTIEIGIRGILQREDVLVNTLKKQGNTALRNCVLRSTSNCRHNKVYKVDFYMLGTKKPFTGSKVLYTDGADPCFKPGCGDYQIQTSLRTRCMDGKTRCPRPGYITIRYDIKKRGVAKAIRSDYVEHVANLDQKFPKLDINCPRGQVLRGIGTAGDPICVRVEDVIMFDENNSAQQIPKNLSVKTKDCRVAGSDKQYFVSAISDTGEVICSEHSW